MRISAGIKEDGVVVGNLYDKYGSRNPVVKWLMRGFHNSLAEMVKNVSPKTIHEIGCGEGYWVIQWNHQGIKARGSDFSAKIIELAQKNALAEGLSPDIFMQRSIDEINYDHDSADLLVCCEVLEHLQCPENGLRSLQKTACHHLILSVPREPLWSFLNIARGKYITDYGNTPGHIQRWSQRAFLSLVLQYFEVIDIKKPLPWTMLLCRLKG